MTLSYVHALAKPQTALQSHHIYRPKDVDLGIIPSSPASQLAHTPLSLSASTAHPTEEPGAGGMATPPKGDN